MIVNMYNKKNYNAWGICFVPYVRNNKERNQITFYY